MPSSYQRPIFRTEQIAYWFFRINGCLNIINFLVHHERRGYEGTDVDILAVRFPFRRELAWSHAPMEDHPIFDSSGKVDIIICEVKSSLCDLNGPWTDPEKKNMDRVLSAIGAFPKEKVREVADALYSQKIYEGMVHRVRLFAVGERTNTSLSDSVAQLTWEEMLTFIYERFRKYSDEKAQHSQWDRTGYRLFRKMKRHRTVESFVNDVMWEMEL